jgi:hypothetical protein
MKAHDKPYDEEWSAETSCVVRCNDADKTTLVRTADWFSDDAAVCDPSLGAKRVALAAAAPAMYRLLSRIEIVGDGACWCPACHQIDANHTPNCEWVEVMRLARGET